MKTVLLLHFCTSYLGHVFVFSLPIITTKYGNIKGISAAYQHKDEIIKCSAFLGIPYAQSPAFLNRFKPPFPLEPWTEVRDATRFAPKCIQMPTSSDKLLSDDQSEDCLYLNIFSKENVNETSAKAVMVFIHGGGYLIGSARDMSPEDICKYFVSKDIIFVTIQYRLGYFGFLSTGDDHAPGNWGIMDQIEALKWVHDNIRNFGGDSDRITLVGNSAGGASVSLLTLIPSARSYFHQAIAKSGNIYAYWAFSDAPSESFNRLSEGKEVNCGDNKRPTETRLNCLRKVPLKNLQQVQFEKFGSPFTQKFKRRNADYGEGEGIGCFELISPEWTPVVDSVLIMQLPEELAKSALPIPFITGTTSYESIWVYEGEQKLKQVPPQLNLPNGLPCIIRNLELFQLDNLLATFSSALTIYNKPHNFTSTFHRKISKVEGAKLKTHFANRGDIENKTAQVWELIQLLSDVISNYPALEDAQRKKNAGSKVWLYDFDYILEKKYSDTDNYFFVGAGHSDDLLLLFGKAYMRSIQLTKKDLEMRDLMTDLWTNFAKFGDPTPGPKQGKLGFIWPQYESLKNSWNLHFKEVPEVKSTFHSASLELWTSASEVFTVSAVLRDEL